VFKELGKVPNADDGKRKGSPKKEKEKESDTRKDSPKKKTDEVSFSIFSIFIFFLILNEISLCSFYP